MTVRAKRGQWPDKYGNYEIVEDKVNCPRREITEVVYDGSGPWLVVSGYRVGSDCHRYLSGRSDHLGGMASSCACGGAS